MSLNRPQESGYFNFSIEDNNSNVPNYSLDEIKKKFNLKFNVLVADCEGFLETFFDDNPEMYDELNLIIYERDNDCETGGNRKYCNYKKIEKKLKEKGFKIIASRGYGTRDYVWKK